MCVADGVPVIGKGIKLFAVWGLQKCGLIFVVGLTMVELSAR